MWGSRTRDKGPGVPTGSGLLLRRPVSLCALRPQHRPHTRGNVSREGCQSVPEPVHTAGAALPGSKGQCGNAS